MEYPRFDLDGRVALVTGASRGIGRDLVRVLAHAGATVVAAARHIDDVTDLVSDVIGTGRQASAVSLDVRDPAAAAAAVQATVDRHGALDVLVNNAGVGINQDALLVTEAEWDEMMAVNLRGLFFACQAAGRHMVPRRYGRIINISSQAGTVGIRRHIAYCASKGAVNQVTRVLALEWGPHGITVNAVAPTFIRTPGTAERLDDPGFLADVLRRIPAGRVGTTIDVAGAVLYLASPAASLVNGAVLAVDGGWTVQ
ncbi:MAG TPA: glucose 1-dehydrogenase [Micromonosporaceae bacterium]